jgi:hypothetical protein
MNNQEFTEALQTLAESKRPEYICRGTADSLATMTDEAKSKAEELRRQAVALAASVASSAEPWETIAGAQDMLPHLVNQNSPMSVRLHEMLELYEDVFLAGGSIHRAIYDDAKRDYEKTWGINALYFCSFEEWCAKRGCAGVPEPVKA